MEASSLQDFLGRVAEANTDILIALGRLESKVKAKQLKEVAVGRPVYITGLARSGTTILLELLAEHPDIATHRYKDFPLVFTPLIWNWFLKKAGNPDEEPIERSHKDGIMITPDSPEAMEEMLWMAFFETCHDHKTVSVLSGNTSHPAFEEFYDQHIKKMLCIRGGQRYAAKNNYNISRLAYLLKLYPDARFIVPLRDPIWHVASLIKQHRLLGRLHKEDPRTLEYMRRSGHFEFGLDRRALNVGDTTMVEGILELWKKQDEVRGWARYWAMIHDFIASQLEQDPLLADRTLVVDYQQLCGNPYEMLGRIYRHAGLEADQALLGLQTARLKTPDYYQPDFSADEIRIIEQETAVAAERLNKFAV